MLFADSAASFKGRALRCSVLVRYRLHAAFLRRALRLMRVCATLRGRPTHSACICAGIARERFSCVARCMDAPRAFCVAVPRLCTQRVLSAVLWRPAHSARICAVPSIVALALCCGRKRQENYTASRPLPRIPCFASTCSLGATPARRGIQRGWMPGSPGGRCTGRRRANWSWCS